VLATWKSSPIQAQYSASLDDLDTLVYGLVLRETSDEPKKKHMFETGLISRHPSKSTPKNPKKLCKWWIGEK